MTRRPYVSVIIPHYRDLNRLSVCLDALEKQSLSRDRFEIVVADNASPEGEEEVARVIAGRARLVVVREKGAGPARNGGVAVSRGEILAFTDCDCLPRPDWLEQGVAALADADFVGGRVIVQVDQTAEMTGAEAFEAVFAFDNRAYVERKGFTVTANLFCSRTLFDRIGGFRVGVPEDLEWCRRAVAGGFRLRYAGAAIVAHPARRDWSELVSKWRRLNLEAWGLTSGDARGRLLWGVRSLALPISAVAHTPKVLLSSNLASWRQRWRALATLFRLRFWRMADSLRLLTSTPVAEDGPGAGGQRPAAGDDRLALRIDGPPAGSL